MIGFDAEKYISLVENIDDRILQAYMKDEKRFILGIKDAENKTIIDIGAGYGRVLGDLAKNANKVISIEINPNMIKGLRKRSMQFRNSVVIEGNAVHLSLELSGKEIKNPVLIVLQNTLGTIEGDSKTLLAEMKSYAKSSHGEIILSLFRQEALKGWGIRMYSKIMGMVGEVDLEKTDFNKGIFFSKTGYCSKWWSLKEITKIKDFLGGKLIHEVSGKCFFIFHIKF